MSWRRASLSASTHLLFSKKTLQAIRDIWKQSQYNYPAIHGRMVLSYVKIPGVAPY